MSSGHFAACMPIISAVFPYRPTWSSSRSSSGISMVSSNLALEMT
jgi:hypothetical protein